MAQAPDSAGWSIPNYRLIKRVGQGAFGEVWLADEVLTRICRAVKIVPGAGTSKSTHRRIELEGVREYQQRSSGHDHLIQVLTVGETADSLYYVMEAADNALGSRAASLEDYEPATLSSVLRREGRLSLDVALEHVSSMLAGIEHLHSSGLAHRDLKPSNVLFVDGVLKLADVGLASHDSTGSVGTPPYRTPDGTPDDLYAVGVMLYEMITGQAPSRFPELPADLDGAHDHRRLKEALRMIDRACQPEASQRYESASQFLRAVRRVRHPRRFRASRRAWGLVGALLAVLPAAVFWFWATRPAVPEWSQLDFVADSASRKWTTFPEKDHDRPSRFRVQSAVDGLREKRLILSGEFDVGYVQPEAIMSLLLAVDDRIVHVIYWDKPCKNGQHRVFNNRFFRLRNDLLKTIAAKQPCPVYVVLAPTDHFFEFCEEYAAAPFRCNRILIGHIQPRYQH